jgi:hypothetical protein
VRCRQIGTGQEIHGSYSHRSSVEGGDSGMVRSKGVSFFLREGRGLSFIVSGFTHSCYQDAVQSLLRILKTRKNFFTRMVLFAGKTSKCVYSQLYGEDKQVGSAHHQPESRNSPEKGHYRYKYWTGSPTRPTPTQQP